MIVSDSTIAELHIFNILMKILSEECALLTSNDLIILLISLLSSLTDDRLVFVTKDWISGILLLLFEGVHWDVRNH